uniref:Reverse transcriptase Ty1/copia-type domain-containing protein n=1 Tax=Tanacetum cinerariifolium TaxID=118510 RepID=A0A699H5H6_TANCI|nr:hypothetical protein [Tanacetum cinerariifolium]
MKSKKCLRRLLLITPHASFLNDKKASDYDNPNPVPQRQDVSSSPDAHVPSQQELDLLFGPLYDEFFNAGSNPKDTQPTTNIQPTSPPSIHTYVHAKENTDNQAEEEYLQDNEFTNPFCVPAQEVAESSSHNIEQVCGNPSRPVQTRRQLATDPEMCMCALTVSTAEPKNIKEAMSDSAWIEAMQEELHQFDRLQVWELVDKPFGKTVIRLKCCTLGSCSNFYRIRGTQVFSNLSDGRENGISQWSRRRFMLHRFVDPDHPEKVYRLRAWYESCSLWIEASSKGVAKYALEILHKHGIDKGQSIDTPMATKPKLDADLSGNPVDQTHYRSKIGSLMYLTSSRPDIVFDLTAFSNVDHAGCIDSLKSTFRGIQFLGDQLVSWMSKKQNCTAMSSAEAEYVALSTSFSHSNLMQPRTALRTKHIHTRYHFIKEQVENGINELYFVKTEYQLADMFTKALPEDMFKYLVRRIGMRCLTLAELEVLANESA